ncbi:MAG: hypothetical protein KDE23_20010, partial [Caldilinea sp.]|nr:hypothetical protein [Caldilinea sp.]
EGETASLEVIWVVEPAGGDESGDDGSDVSSESGSDTGDGEEPASGSEDLAGGDEGAPDSETGAAEVPAITLAAAGALSVPGLDAWANYGWQAPVDFGDCPAGVDARTPASLDGDLFADTFAADPAGAPRLSFAADLLPGEYALLVCGCAPAYGDGERTSAPAGNQALFAGIDGVAFLDEAGIPAQVTGFADTPGFTWQALSALEGGPALITVPEEGASSVDLWMADDGVLVSGVRVVPVAALADAVASTGQACVGGE